MKKTGIATNIDDYIAQQPERIQSMLKQIRKIIREEAPEAIEKISYQMPAFSLNGILVYFAGQKNHIGFYPGAPGIEAFKEELLVYKGGKGSVQFPFDKPLPLKLIRDIVKFRVIQNSMKRR